VRNAVLPVGRIVFDPNVDRNFPPLHTVLVHLFIQLFGRGEAPVRLPSVIAGTISIPLMFGVVRTWLGPAMALLAACLLAISPLHVWYSQEARPYALFMAIALASLWFAQRLLQRPTGRLFQAGFVLSASATLYCHLLALPFLLFLAVYAMWNVGHRDRPRMLVLLALIGALTAPQLYQFWGSPPPVSANRSYSFNPVHLGYTVWAFGTGYSLGPSPLELRAGMTALGRHLPVMIPVLCGLAVLLWLGARDLWHMDRRTFWVTGAWLGFPLAFAVIGSVFSTHPFNVRYVLLSLPPFVLLLAAGVYHRAGRLTRLAALGFLAVVSLGALRNYYLRPEYQREDNRGATAFLNAHAGPGELVIASAPYTTVLLRHYGLRADLDLRPYPSRRVEGRPQEFKAGLERLSRDEERVWLFLSRTFHGDPDGAIAAYFDSNFRRGLEHTSAGVQVRAYERERGPGAPMPQVRER
jgi:mannosyltransferase